MEKRGKKNKETQKKENGVPQEETRWDKIEDDNTPHELI